MEAYGNAKTVNNNNSSRFVCCFMLIFVVLCMFSKGKYMEILFDVKGDPVGGNVTNCMFLVSFPVRFVELSLDLLEKVC